MGETVAVLSTNSVGSIVSVDSVTAGAVVGEDSAGVSGLLLQPESVSIASANKIPQGKHKNPQGGKYCVDK